MGDILKTPVVNGEDCGKDFINYADNNERIECAEEGSEELAELWWRRLPR